MISPYSKPVWSEELLLVFAPFTYWAFSKILDNQRYGLMAAMSMLLLQYSLAGILPELSGHIWLWGFYVLYLVFVLKPATPDCRALYPGRQRYCSPRC